MHLLDTNILSELIKRQPNPKVAARFEALPDDELFTSAICVEEIAFGARIAPPGNRVWERFDREVLPWLTVLDFDLNAALTGGALRGDWHARHPDRLRRQFDCRQRKGVWPRSRHAQHPALRPCVQADGGELV